MKRLNFAMVNPMMIYRVKAFYCMGFSDENDNSCGPLTDTKDDLPFCHIDGNMCGTSSDHNSIDGCDCMCKHFCCWPGSGAIKVSDIDTSKQGGDLTNREYKQYKNIASSVIACMGVAKFCTGRIFGSIVICQIAGLLVC
jgi:hypothetical protein